MSSFKGIGFGERGQNGTMFPRPRRKAASGTLHTLNGGNRVQHSGRNAATITMPVRCTEAQLNSLDAAVATTGTLIFSGGTRTAFLDEIDPQEVVAGKNKFFVTLTFILL